MGFSPSRNKHAEEKSSPLEALFPGLRCRILQALYREPDHWWTLEDLAQQLSLTPASLRVTLSALLRGGVLRQKKGFTRSQFQANPDCLFFSELHKIFTKTATEQKPISAPALETILVVEDEPATLKIACILLESWGYRVLSASSPHEAVEVFANNEAAIRLLVTDVVMPGMQGPELALRLRERNPALRVVYMSGYQGNALSADGSFLPKPFTPAGLARAVRQELDRT